MPWFPGIRAVQEHVFWAGLVQLHPESRGWVELKSADPREVAAVTLNIMAEEADREQMRRAIRTARADLQHPADGRPARRASGRRATQVESDDELDAFIRASLLLRAASDQHLRDGHGRALGGRCRAARDRRRGAARGRRLGHADGAGRQHQPAGDHDRREGGRPDQGPEPAARRNWPHEPHAAGRGQPRAGARHVRACAEPDGFEPRSTGSLRPTTSSTTSRSSRACASLKALPRHDPRRRRPRRCTTSSAPSSTATM